MEVKAASCPAILVMGKESLVPNEQKYGLAQEPVWMFWRREKKSHHPAWNRMMVAEQRQPI